MSLFVVKMGRILQTFRLIRHLLLWSGNRSLEAILLQRDIGELKTLYKRRQIPFFPPPAMDTSAEVMVIQHPGGTAEGKAPSRSPH